MLQQMRVGQLAAAVAGLALLSASTASAALVIDVGTIELLPNEPDQEITISVTGGDQVQGFELNVQIGDGGSDLGGTDIGPFITDVELIDGTIFEFAPGVGADDTVAFERAIQSTVTADATVAAEGVVAVLTVSTVGQTPDTTFPFLLTEVAGSFDTKFFDGSGVEINPTITDGFITILPVPEPMGVALLGVAGLGLMRRRS